MKFLRFFIIGLALFFTACDFEYSEVNEVDIEVHLPFNKYVSSGTLFYGYNSEKDSSNFKSIYCTDSKIIVKSSLKSIFIFYPEKFYKPAGAFFSEIEDCGNGKFSISLKYKNGFLAEIFSDLKYEKIENLNIEKLCGLIEEKSENPWLLDSQKLKQDLYLKKVNSFSLYKRKLYSISISNLTGTWHSSYFNGESFRDISGITKFYVPKGFSSFYNFEEEKELSIFLESEDKFEYMVY